MKYAQKYLIFCMADSCVVPTLWSQRTQISGMVLHFQTMNLTLLIATYSVNVMSLTLWEGHKRK